MVVPLILAAMSLCMIAPVSTAPLATSTTIVIPDIVTMTVGFIAPTEIPDMQVPDLSGSKNALSENKSPGSLPRLPDILARQIRIDDYDAAGNMSWPPLGGPTLLKRNKKKDAEDRARLKSLQDDAAVPSAAPQGLDFGSPTKAASSTTDELGESRMDVSDTFHSLLGTAFSGANAQNNDQNASSTTHYTYDKDATEPAMPVGPGYTTDTMNVPAPKAARRDVQREAFSRVSITHGKRHSMMFDLNALLPEPPSTTDTTAAEGPTPAWQNMGFVDIDSNRAPPPLPVPQNVTEAAEDVSQAPGDVAHAPANITSAA